MVERALGSLRTDIMICDNLSALTQIIESEFRRAPSDKIRDFIGDLWEEIKQKSTEDEYYGY